MTRGVDGINEGSVPRSCLALRRCYGLPGEALLLMLMERGAVEGDAEARATAQCGLGRQ